MEVRIGVLHGLKELSVEVEGSADDVTKLFDAALASDDAIVWLTDTDGQRVGIPTDKLAYVEIEEQGSANRVGFGRP